MNLRNLLIVSLIVNLALGALVLRKPESATSAVASTPSVEARGSTDLPKAKAKAKVQTVREAVTNTVVKKFNWESVESGDYKEYIANLRSIGCPEETIRDIILADVNKLYDQKKKQLRGTPQKYEFWKSGNPWMPTGDAETIAKIRTLDEERGTFLRSLGIEPDFKTEAANVFNPFETMLDFLPDNKKTQVMKMFSEMQAKMAKLSKDGNPDPKEMMKVQREVEEMVKQQLSPEEALQYELRFSMTANMMRNQVAGFDPSEDEFMKVYKLRKGFDEQFSPMGMGDESEAERDKRQKAEKELKQEIKQALGDERYKDYELAQDWQFQQTLRALKRADLGVAEAKQVNVMKKLAEEQASSIRNDKSLSQAQKTTALEAIRTETESSFKKYLGDKGWESYNRPNNVYWLDSINRKPQTTKAAGQ
jgi:hypothetical protein